ncbi:DUF6207 family protein [Streptomyces sp. DSM 41524]|uniref:DUF6207 family protein n=1 Tax=Streptomyces asiaticus subsp. ignotus TaxID=3098222 RepID=A0ABU7Q9Q6_9ACTN|nr:DUF6207 family protein [Streptomyces sp. DSM 41524]
MDRIDDVHVSGPGLVVLDITARDEETAEAVMSRLDELWATSGAGLMRRVAGVRGVRARLHADIRGPVPRPGVTS